MPATTLSAAKPEFLHDEFVEISLRTRERSLLRRWRDDSPRVVVTRDGRVVETIAGLADVPLAYDRRSGAWRGRWPCPWNAPSGEYTLELPGDPKGGGRRATGKFRIGRRRPSPVPEGFSVLTWEDAAPLAGLKVRAPDGSVKDWRGLLDWVEYVGADAFWMLAGETPGKGPDEIWITDNFALLPEVGRECRRRGLKFGVYAKVYLTASKERSLTRYQYAMEVEGGVPVPTRAISLRDPRRPADAAALLKAWARIPEVDYVGLDYIRNALGGYELAEDFYAEMTGVVTPPDWSRLSPGERMVYFARKKIMRRDQAFIDAWQWWRAHKTAAVVRRIKAEVGSAKPLWAFTLTWEKGWNHGQDPVMMNDAGVDIDALMMYEADEEQFGIILRDFRRYVRRGDVQLLVGDVIDWPLHQRDPLGPESLRRRMIRAADGVFADGPAQGIFVHDLARALGGRLGAWGTRAWLDQAKAVVRHVKNRAGATR